MKIWWLAWRYILHNRWKTSIMVACITLTLLLPVAISVVIAQFNRQIVARALSTPFVVGTRGSRLDLALHAIYFEGQPPESITYEYVDRVTEDGLAQAIPVHSKYTAQGMTVVGTTLDYFDFRSLKVAQGELIARVGDCILGWNVARQLDLKPGDRLLTQSDNVTDIAGSYPLNMLVTGLFERTGTPDDNAVFIDIKTAWVIDGHGHGHVDVKTLDAETLLGVEGNKRVASAAVQPYLEFDEASLVDMHFHGEMKNYPLSAIVVLPRDEKSATILLGRINRQESLIQMVEPIAEVKQLMSIVFQIKRLFNANSLLTGASTLLLLLLVVMLSLRLRKSEMQTMFKLGCGRGTLWFIQAAELCLIFIMALLLIGLATLLVVLFAPDLIRWLTSVT